MSHTKEQWVLKYTDDGKEIEDLLSGGIPVPPTIANARRIVACVNACADIETPTIEGVSLKKLWEDHKALMVQQDQLLHAAVEAKIQIEYLHGKFKETASGNCVLSMLKRAIDYAKE